jgi:hypothetical protein
MSFERYILNAAEYGRESILEDCGASKASDIRLTEQGQSQSVAGQTLQREEVKSDPKNKVHTPTTSSTLALTFATCILSSTATLPAEVSIAKWRTSSLAEWDPELFIEKKKE